MEYAIIFLAMGLILLAFIPAMIGAYKGHRFSAWYVYGILLLPAAVVHAVILKKPARCINVYMQNPRKRRTYKKVPDKKSEKKISAGYVAVVFLSKLIFGTFCAAVFYTVCRVFVYDTPVLRTLAISFAVIFSVMLSVVELYSISHITILADEITKRALYMIAFSAIASLPLFLIENVLCALWSDYSEFWTFLCTVVSFGVFAMLIVNMQQRYYSIFQKFSDYTVLSMLSYSVFAAIMLICLSFPGTRSIGNALCLPMRLFNTEYLSAVGKLIDASYIYFSAISHLLMEIIILISGALCYKYKKREMQYRIEYREKAFRMSRKRILRRHIPSGVGVKPLR